MFDFERLISGRAKSVDSSGIRRVFDLAANLKDPINLSIGQPDFDVPENVKRAAIEAIEGGQNQYTVTQGLGSLNEKVRGEVEGQFGKDGRWGDFGTLITSGVSGGLLLAMMAMVEEGDEVIAPDPYFVMYKHLISLVGGKPVLVDTYPDFQLTAERVEAAMTDRTKLVVMSSPSNPTGVVASSEGVRELVELCARRNVLLVSDEIYNVFYFGDGVCPSGGDYSDQLLVLRGFSKTYGMTGWRLGYAAGPRAVVEQMTKLQQYTFVCAPSMVQAAGCVAMGRDMSEYVEAYRRKRDMVVERLGGHFELTMPEGAFYAFPKVGTGETGTKFVERAIERKVLIIPGSVFSERDTHFRLSYACEDSVLERGLDVLVELAGG